MTAQGVPLRRRVLVVIVSVTALAVALFLVPLAIAVNILYHDQTVAALQRDAAWVATAVPDEAARDAGAGLKLPARLSGELAVGGYAVDGTRLFGEGPARSPLAASSRDGHVHDMVENGFLAVSAPVPSDEGTALVIRVATPNEQIDNRIHQAWLLMGGLALLVIALAAGAAVRQSTRLAAPLERLTTAAQALGGGDFSIRAARSGLREADQAAQALEATARRLGDVLARERAFSADVSHQLRTGLTGLLLGLESALSRPGADLAPAVQAALARGERLQEVLDDLVRLSRDSRAPAEPLDVDGLMEEVRQEWHGQLARQGRRLTITVEPALPPVTAQPAAVRQVLHVLLDNALRHGRGEVAVTVSDVGPGIAVEVSDHGPGVAPDSDPFIRSSGHSHGIGLALARSLAEAEGGRLVLSRARPPLFSLLLPGHDT
ncbi:HAMP domain-containing sensor histidine kinase [Nonomuraea roseoviolacea]|uniref:histidine kinase n=1 Tax=Nonomuraea roseoviolacea subsp. carminata TaxID=160689 RepID=A0ABT1JQL9_9ACTN|nr:HAMP domain-containing sensor histidine kinase [Nonomuraea roseoviolacea]MCP2344009.1 signal transduction histidine kinase [Nonomuraea roseoviolacea subsp. carminata]